MIPLVAILQLMCGMGIMWCAKAEHRFILLKYSFVFFAVVSVLMAWRRITAVADLHYDVAVDRIMLPGIITCVWCAGTIFLVMHYLTIAIRETPITSTFGQKLHRLFLPALFVCASLLSCYAPPSWDGVHASDVTFEQAAQGVCNGPNRQVSALILGRKIANAIPSLRAMAIEDGRDGLVASKVLRQTHEDTLR